MMIHEFLLDKGYSKQDIVGDFAGVVAFYHNNLLNIFVPRFMNHGRRLMPVVTRYGAVVKNPAGYTQAFISFGNKAKALGDIYRFEIPLSDLVHCDSVLELRDIVAKKRLKVTKLCASKPSGYSYQVVLPVRLQTTARSVEPVYKGNCIEVKLAAEPFTIFTVGNVYSFVPVKNKLPDCLRAFIKQYNTGKTINHSYHTTIPVLWGDNHFSKFSEFFVFSNYREKTPAGVYVVNKTDKCCKFLKLVGCTGLHKCPETPTSQLNINLSSPYIRRLILSKLFAKDTVRYVVDLEDKVIRIFLKRHVGEKKIPIPRPCIGKVEAVYWDNNNSVFNYPCKLVGVSPNDEWIFECPLKTDKLQRLIVKFSNYWTYRLNPACLMARGVVLDVFFDENGDVKEIKRGYNVYVNRPEEEKGSEERVRHRVVEKSTKESEYINAKFKKFLKALTHSKPSESKEEHKPAAVVVPKPTAQTKVKKEDVVEISAEEKEKVSSKELSSAVLLGSTLIGAILLYKMSSE